MPPNQREAKIPNTIDRAFFNCTSLTSIKIPDSVTSIGDGAFSDCSSLASIEIPNSVTSIGKNAFVNCFSLTSIDIPDSVTSIGEHAFSFCTALTSIEIPDSVTSIGKNAFMNCTALTSVIVESGSIGDFAFFGCGSLKSVTIGKGVASIGGSAFRDCSSLSSVHITDVAAWCKIEFEDNPLQYAHHLYLGETEIKELVIPDGVTEIKEDAFYNCTSLASVKISDSVTSIGDKAFHECSSLTSITIGNGVTSIGSSAFSGCYKLIEVWNHSELPLEEGKSSYGCVALYAKDVYQGDEPSKQIEEDGYLFYEDGGESYLLGYLGEETELTLPQVSPSGKRYAIYRYAFSNDDFLTSIVISNGVTSIGESAFSNCTSLTDVRIGSGVTLIERYAFNQCPSLISVTFDQPSGWFIAEYQSATSGTELSSAALSNQATAVKYLTNNSSDGGYVSYYWKRK